MLYKSKQGKCIEITAKNKPCDFDAVINQRCMRHHWKNIRENEKEE